MNLRKAQEKDLNSIMEIEKESFDNKIQEKDSTFLERIRIFDDGFIILENNNETAGYFCSEIWDNIPQERENFELNHNIKDRPKINGSVLYVSSIAIKQKYRGNGFGYSLFSEGVQIVLKKFPEIKEVVLLVNELWENAIKIYKREGFVEYGRLKEFFEQKEGFSDGIMMRKKYDR